MGHNGRRPLLHWRERDCRHCDDPNPQGAREIDRVFSNMVVPFLGAPRPNPDAEVTA